MLGDLSLLEEGPVMSDLNNFFTDLLDREEQPYRQLIDQWPQDLCDTVVSAFEDAVSKASVKSSICPLKPRSSNQSIGNQIEKYIVQELGSVILGFSISKCSGSGYPDQILIQQTTQLKMPLEMKATAEWDEKDSNRRVLTSSSDKLRNQFSAPIHHLLLTGLYSKKDDEDFAAIDAIRLDFLEPTTVVNVRLEASVSHKLLVGGHHYSKTI